MLSLGSADLSLRVVLYLDPLRVCLDLMCLAFTPSYAAGAHLFGFSSGMSERRKIKQHHLCDLYTYVLIVWLYSGGHRNASG